MSGTQPAWRIRNGLLADPLTGTSRCGDIFLHDGVIRLSAPAAGTALREIDASGCVIAPGLIDLHVHLREPGNEAAETLASGGAAAARGGFTTVVAMPNTNPPADTPDRMAWTLAHGRTAPTRILPSGCLTLGRLGRRPADLAGMAAAGAAAFTDDGGTVPDEGIMEEAMHAAAAVRRTVMDHALDPRLAASGVMHEGDASARCGLPGIPSEAERRIVERDIRLCERTGCRTHIQHVSARESIELIRAARARGLPVSGEATPHHLALCDEDVDPADPDFKMNPPLRARADMLALRAAVANGALEAIATDHAPHTAADKGRGFLKAPFGVVGLETAVGITYPLLVLSGAMSLCDWLERLTVGPARLLGLPPPSLTDGARADIVVLDLAATWTVQPGSFVSRSHNTPFKGRPCQGRARQVFLAGSKVFDVSLSSSVGAP